MNDGYRPCEEGSVLILVLLLLLLMTSLGMSLLFATDVDLKASKWHSDWVTSKNDGDVAVGEVLWRMNMNDKAAPPPVGYQVSVNQLSNYNARIDFDENHLLTNSTDDDGDGSIDEADELHLVRDWLVRMTLTTDDVDPGVPYEVDDTDLADPGLLGSRHVLPTMQPASSWKAYTTDDYTNDNEVLEIRYKKDDDVGLGSGDRVIFWDPLLASNGIEDPNTLEQLGGDGDPATDSPYNLSYSDGVTTWPATGSPVMLVRTNSRVVRGDRTVMSRQLEAELAADVRRPFSGALCGCSLVRFQQTAADGVGIDSYKSTEGDYVTAYTNGDVGSNGDIGCRALATINGSISAAGQVAFANQVSLISGDISSGDSVNGPYSCAGTVYENVVPAPAPCACEAYDVVTMVLAAQSVNDNATIRPGANHAFFDGTATVAPGSDIFPLGGAHLVVGANRSIILEGGDYYFDTVSIGGTVYVGNDTSSPPDGIPDQAPTTPVRIFVLGGMIIDGGGFASSSDARPFDLQIFVQTIPNPDITILGASEFKGVIYAPHTRVHLQGTGAIKGAILADQILVENPMPIHFDEQLKNDLIRLGDVRLIAWKEQR